jgi:hypothetical protein
MSSSTERGVGPGSRVESGGRAHFRLKAVHSQRGFGLQEDTLSRVFDRRLATIGAVGRAIGGLRLERDVGGWGRGVFLGGVGCQVGGGVAGWRRTGWAVRLRSGCALREPAPSTNKNKQQLP